MTVLFRRYSGFPPELFEDGIIKRLSDCSVRMYFLLCRESDRKSNRRFAITDAEALEKANISATSMRKARIELKSNRLIECRRGRGGIYTYELCDATTGKPYPGDPKANPRELENKRGALAETKELTSIRQPDTPINMPKSAPTGRIDYKFDFSEDEEATSFPYGANVGWRH